MKNLLRIFIFVCFLVTVAGATDISPPPEKAEQYKIPVYTYKIINTYPHDKWAFTQGLVFEDPFMYEGTGFYKFSSIRKIELESGKVLKTKKLPILFYGEGITIYRDKIIQLTWKKGTAFVYDKKSFEKIKEFKYSTQGWGITHNGNKLIMSDGSNILRFLDPETFKETGQLKVYDDKGPVEKINELEYINGEIYANIWRSERIAKIDPITGKVTGWIDLKGLYEMTGSEDFLNGIAYDKEHDRLFVTAKLKPKLYEIKIIKSE